MKLKYLLMLLGILMIIPIGFSASITKFQPGNTSNVTIAFPVGGGSNTTYYFQVPNYVYFTSSTMNITGLIENGADDTEDSGSNESIGYCNNGEYGYDENWSTSAYISTSGWNFEYGCIVYENYTIPTNKDSVSIFSKYALLSNFNLNRTCDLNEFQVWCWNSSGSYESIFINTTTINSSSSYSIPNSTFSVPSSCLSGTILKLKTRAKAGTTDGSGARICGGYYYESLVYWINASYPTNFSIDISNDGDTEFNQSGSFNTTNTTSDFSSELNDWLLNNCSSSSCNIFINLSSETPGKTELSILTLNYSNAILDNCSTFNNTLLNFSLKDEEDPTTSLNGDIDIVIETPTYNYTFSVKNTSNYALCLAPSQSSVNITKAMIEYSSKGYETSNYSVRDYYLYDTTLSSEQDIDLFLLKDTVGENVLFHTTDSAGANYPNVYGKIQRYYVGENVYRTVAMIYTDDQGEALTNLDLLDTWYKFILEKDGTVLKNTNPTEITSSEYYFKIYTTTAAFENYLAALGLSYTFTYNDTTNITRLEYNSASGIVSSVCLDITHDTLSKRETIYSHCESSNSATIFYDLTNDTESGKYFAYASVINNNGNKQTLEIIEITRVSATTTVFGLEGVTLTAFGAGTAMFIGMFNPIAPIILGLLTMFGLVKFGFFNLGTATMVSLSTAGGILIYYLRRK